MRWWIIIHTLNEVMNHHSFFICGDESSFILYMRWWIIIHTLLRWWVVLTFFNYIFLLHILPFFPSTSCLWRWVIHDSSFIPIAESSAFILFSPSMVQQEQELHSSISLSNANVRASWCRRCKRVARTHSHTHSLTRTTSHTSHTCGGGGAWAERNLHLDVPPLVDGGGGYGDHFLDPVTRSYLT